MRKPKIDKRVGTTTNCTVMKKEYVKVEIKAKNAPTGSYAAGCPEHTRICTDQCYNPNTHVMSNCASCEVAR